MFFRNPKTPLAEDFLALSQAVGVKFGPDDDER
jgi:hypothetical protein